MRTGRPKDKGLHISKEYLIEEYINKNRSQIHIAKDCHTSHKLITYYLKKYNIPRKSKSFALKSAKIKRTDTFKNRLSIIRKIYFQEHPNIYDGKKNPMFNKKHSEETIKKIIRNSRKYTVQTKPEIFLEKVLNQLLPKEYKFVGRGEVIIANKLPDFINVNGQKKIIEMYGDYWHRNDNPQNRIDLFKQYGYDTLIVWEKELKDLYKLSTKLNKFHYNE